MEQVSRYISLFKIKLTQEEFRSKFTAGILLGFLLLATVFFLLPSYNKIKLIRDKSKVAKARFNDLERLRKTYLEASNNYDLIKANIPVFDELIPKNPSPSSFLDKLNYFSLKSNIFLGQTTLIEKSKGVERRSFLLRGNFHEIEDFFNTLNEDSRLYQVESLDISKKDKGTKSNFALSMEIMINTYYEK